jgi:hypothetical protein
MTDSQVAALRKGAKLTRSDGREAVVLTDARPEKSGQNTHEVWIKYGGIVERLTYRTVEEWKP